MRTDWSLGKKVLLWAGTLGVVALGWLFLIVGGAAVQIGMEELVGWFHGLGLGPWGDAAFLIVPLAILVVSGTLIDRRDERRRYAATKTIDGTATRSPL